jgi:GNAT superfamily N-acetyltransferase
LKAEADAAARAAWEAERAAWAAVWKASQAAGAAATRKAWKAAEAARVAAWAARKAADAAWEAERKAAWEAARGGVAESGFYTTTKISSKSRLDKKPKKIPKKMKMETEEKIEKNGKKLYVNVTLNGKRIAAFVFRKLSESKDSIDKILMAQDISVIPKYRGRGIAKWVYDSLKSQRYTILRSTQQTPEGEHFWDKNKGAISKVWEQGAAEGKYMKEASYINGRVEDPKSLCWKQTSLSYDAAVKKYGKNKVKLDGKNRLGKDIVMVFVPLGGQV